jgi:four helix bundle protein
MKDFKKLDTWKLGMEIASETYKYAEYLPKNEQYGLISQMTRAAVSIPANIAEGGSTFTDKHYKKYLSIAMGSSYELETLVLIAQTSYRLSDELTQPLVNKVISEQRMLNSFIRKLKD